ncbi:MAG: family signal peptidase [Frondihabitans sp.]|nr:family signal peptidase [Frondihabitans sp.]
MSATRSTGRSAGRFIRDIVVIFLAALLISFLLKTFVVRSFFIPSGSMENTLLINDRIIVNELTPKVIPLQRGDVVVFTDPGGWLGSEDQVSTTSTNPIANGVQWALTEVGLGTQDSDDHLIKRVIGLPGDTVSCCNAAGQTSVDGVALNEPYTKDPPIEEGQTPLDFSVKVPAGELWVEGDNRYDSEDSRYHQGLPTKGFVPESDVVGRAIVITYPFSRWRWLGNYSDVFAKVEQKEH